MDAACLAGMNQEGSGLLIPVSRGISRAQDPGKAAETLKNNIREAKARVLSSQTSGVKDSDNEIAKYQTEFLEFSLKEQVLRFGSFVLKSGRTSPYFFNAGLFSNGAALYKLGKSYAAAIMDSEQL